MNYKNILLGICILLLLLLVLPLSLANTISYEKTSVSRIQGDSPEDLINQLDVDELNLNHASLYGNPSNILAGEYRKKKNILKRQFDNYYLESGWDYDSIPEDVFISNELLIIESDGEIKNNKPVSEKSTTKFNPQSIKNEFADHYPLFIHDSDYAGLAIPSVDNQVNKLTRYSHMVAPSFMNSRKFVRAFICNLDKEKSLGEIMRDARNKYYELTKPSKKELIGITLMSYHLYGNPLSTITIPNDVDIEKYCKGYENQYYGSSYSTNEIHDSISENIGLIDEVYQIQGFDILNISNAYNILSDYELVEPYVTIRHELPLNAIITNISYSFNNPEILFLDLPMYLEDQLIERECYYDKKNESFEYEIGYSGNKQIIIIKARPLRTDDCTEGDFTLFNQISYDIEYKPYSPIYFDEVNVKKKNVIPDETLELDFDINYIEQTSLNGYFNLYQGEDKIYEYEIVENINNLTMFFNAPDKEAIYNYRLVYNNGTDELFEELFSIEVNELSYYSEITKQGNDFKIELNIINHGETSSTILIKDMLMLDDQIISRSNRTEVVNIGNNRYEFDYNNLLKENLKYEQMFTIINKDTVNTHSNLLVTNHKPVINPIGDYEIEEFDQFILSVDAYDLDGDSLDISVSEPIGNDMVWIPERGDKDNYTIEVIASDGLEDDKEQFNIIVKEGVCEPSWSCTEWSECLEGFQNRTCDDSHNCGVEDEKPLEERECAETIILREFDSGDSQKSFRYSSQGSNKVYIKIPKNAQLKDARFNISGGKR